MSDAPERIGSYEIEERLARGPLGDLYRAVDGSSGQKVAIKVMPRILSGNPEAVERFHRDAEVIAQIDHPNVARILDHDQDGDHVFYAIELGSEIPLGQLLRQRRLSLPEAFTVFKGVALGLEAAQRRDVLHRDLHPANVLVSSDLSTIRVTDFGLSSTVEEVQEVTAETTAIATSTKALHYLAPEQLGKDGTSDERSDIYSLGVLFYEMLTGRVPIGQFNLPSRINAELPAELDRVVLKCLDREPSARYSSVASLVRDIDRMEDKLRLRLFSELEGIGRTFSRPTSHIFKHRKVVAAGVLALTMVAALVLGARYWMSRERSESTPAAAADVSAAEAESSAAALPEGMESPQTEEGAPSAAPEAEGVSSSTEASSAGSAGVAASVHERRDEEATAEASGGATPSTVAPATGLLDAARARAGEGRLDDALAEIETLVAAYPQSTATTEALFLRATIQEAQKRFDEAMDTYTEIGTREGDPAVRAKARYRYGRAALDSGLPNRSLLALGVFEEIPRAFPGTEYAALALASKAAIERSEKSEFESAELGRRVPAAFLTSLRIVEEYPDSPAAEPAFWFVGEQFEALKLWDRAADAYWQLATRFPETTLDAWWKAGQVLDRRLDDRERAIQAYRRVPESSPHADDARKRLAKLTR